MRVALGLCGVVFMGLAFVASSMGTGGDAMASTAALVGCVAGVACMLGAMSMD